MGARSDSLRDSPRAAWTYFGCVLIFLAVASTWIGGLGLTTLGEIISLAPAPFTWPLVDAALFRYARQPTANAPARQRMHWVYAVLAGVVVSILAGALR
jgi:FtsH-binding integral membrane protein